MESPPQKPKQVGGKSGGDVGRRRRQQNSIYYARFMADSSRVFVWLKAEQTAATYQRATPTNPPPPPLKWIAVYGREQSLSSWAVGQLGRCPADRSNYKCLLIKFHGSLGGWRERTCEAQSSNHHVIYLCICPPVSQSVSQPTQPPARQDEGCEGAMSEKRWSPRAIDTALRQTGWQGTQDAGRRPWPWIWIWRSNRPLKPVSHYLIVSLSNFSAISQ